MIVEAFHGETAECKIKSCLPMSSDGVPLACPMLDPATNMQVESRLPEKRPDRAAEGRVVDCGVARLADLAKECWYAPAGVPW